MSQSFEPVGPAWLQYLWTFLFSMLVAAGFTIVDFLMFGRADNAWRLAGTWLQWYGANLVVSVAIGYSIHMLFKLAKRLLGSARVQRMSRWQRGAYYSIIPICGVVMGINIGLRLLGNNVQAWASTGEPNSVVGSILLGLLVWFLFSVYFSTRHQKLAAERRATEAQLKLLQGQIEPHFLFNTLANVLSLMETDTPRAKLMLESFVDYLRSSLGSLRIEGHTLGQELELIEAYLRIVKIRMEDRLRYSIDVPEALRALPLPALTLQPLVENAIVHGLEPKIEGGQISVSARIDADALVLAVEDDGLGLQAVRPAAHTGGNGTALKNIRERLLQSHGDRARLHITANATQGVRATLTLPSKS